MTKIEWTKRAGTKGETWNPIRARNKATGGVGHFCTKVSAGCQNCYAADFQKRFKNTVRYAVQDADRVESFLDEKVLMQPLRWKNPRTIFVCSMTDLFYEGHDDEWIDSVFAVAALCPQHTFIVLTKRIKVAHQYMASIDNNDGGRLDGFRDAMVEGMAQKIYHDRTGEDPSMWLTVHLPLPNVWLGTSVEDRSTANERIPALLQTPATVRFLSAEPLLGPVDLTRIGHKNGEPDQYYNAVDGYEISCGLFEIDGLDWVIVGGESGRNARPMHPDWARNLRDQCKAAGTPFFFKQWGAWAPGMSDDTGFVSHSGRYMNDGTDLFHHLDPTKAYKTTAKVGKKAAGRLLDGVEHNEWPEVVS
jgi:protein gp37